MSLSIPSARMKFIFFVLGSLFLLACETRPLPIKIESKSGRVELTITTIESKPTSWSSPVTRTFHQVRVVVEDVGRDSARQKGEGSHSTGPLQLTINDDTKNDAQRPLLAARDTPKTTPTPLRPHLNRPSPSFPTPSPKPLVKSLPVPKKQASAGLPALPSLVSKCMIDYSETIILTPSAIVVIMVLLFLVAVALVDLYDWVVGEARKHWAKAEEQAPEKIALVVTIDDSDIEFYEDDLVP